MIFVPTFMKLGRGYSLSNEPHRQVETLALPEFDWRPSRSDSSHGRQQAFREIGFALSTQFDAEMSRVFVSAVAFTLALLVTGCSSSTRHMPPPRSNANAPPSTAAVPETQDSGKHGILVPGVATNPTRIGADSVTFDLPGMSLAEAVQWMGMHLPVHDAINGMMPCSVRKSAEMHSWYWGRTTHAPTLSVTVFAAPTTEVGIFAGTDPVGC